MDTLRTKFATLVSAYGNTSELARRAGLSRAAIDYKVRGDRRVTQWDVWAIRAALEDKTERPVRP